MNVLPPELAPYQNQPCQLPTGGLGKNARLCLRFEAREDRSILAVMERRTPLLVQKALYCDEGMPGLPVVYIVSTSGGAVQGDRYEFEFSVGPGACGHITTQAATKVHEMDANYVGQTQEITLEDRLIWNIYRKLSSRFGTRVFIPTHGYECALPQLFCIPRFYGRPDPLPQRRTVPV
jgi:urease accessory protein